MIMYVCFVFEMICIIITWTRSFLESDTKRSKRPMASYLTTSGKGDGGRLASVVEIEKQQSLMIVDDDG
jgi:hypothetical protein